MLQLMPVERLLFSCPCRYVCGSTSASLRVPGFIPVLHLSSFCDGTLAYIERIIRIGCCEIS